MPKRTPDAGFIRANLLLTRVPDVPEIALYLAHPGSRLGGLGGAPPYWAYVWAGGAALARHVLDRGQVRGLHVLDLGAGSGLVGIAAAMAGAASVRALDPDPWAQVAVGVNAAANGVAVAGQGEPDLILCGDVFYDAGVAGAVMPVLDAWVARGLRVLVGDPGRVDLPKDRLDLLAEYTVQDMGDGPGQRVLAGVYAYRGMFQGAGHARVRQSDKG